MLSGLKVVINWITAKVIVYVWSQYDGGNIEQITSSSIHLFRYGYYALTGLDLGLGEPVLGHKDFVNVSLVVNEHVLSFL